MASNRPVFWYQGLFLQPQHFQQSDMYHASVVNSLLRNVHPCFWGVSAMTVREDALKDRTFGISEGSFLFPDGSWVDIPGNSVVQSRTIQPADIGNGKPFKVYLGLKKTNPAGENVTLIKHDEELGAVRTRYISYIDSEEMRDIHQGGSSAEIKMLSFALRLFWEKEIEDITDYNLIPIAEVHLDDNEPVLSADYIPPGLSIASSVNLRNHILNIRDQITSRCRKLEEYKSPKGIQSSDVDTSYITYMLALRSLSRYVPLFHHLTEQDVVHPWDVYGLLRMITGELSTYTDRIDALGRISGGTELIPAYDHMNLRMCFGEASTLIDELLGSLVIGPESIIHLKRENGYFKSNIPAELVEGDFLFYLVLRTAEKQSAVLEMMQRIVKVSSVDNMKTLIGRALPGISMRHSPLPPPGVPARKNSLYFEVDLSHALWIEIQKSRNICLYWDQAPKDLNAELVVLRR